VEISKNTIIGASLGTFLTMAGTIWTTAIFVNGKISLIDQALAAAIMNQVEQVQHDLKHARDFRLELRSYLRNNPGDDGAQEDLDEVEDEIADLEDERDCLRDGKDNC